MGIAVVGFAFGHPQHSLATRPISNKRRAPTRPSFENPEPQPAMPTTPSPIQQSASAPTSRLRKRSSHGRPLTSLGNLRGGTRTVGSTPDGRKRPGTGDGDAPQEVQESAQPIARGSFAFEFRNSENTDPSWPRRVSTLSSLKNESSITTPQPGSPSIAHSNGSTAPILPTFSETSPSTASRNKLVKRSSSQRVLQGSTPLHSTLRRPATSHQRSATLQRQYFEDDEPIQQPVFYSSPLPAHLPEDPQTYDETSQRWRPFFKSQGQRPRNNVSSRNRSLQGKARPNELHNTIKPDFAELPTLLLATSISNRSSDEAANHRASNVSGLSRPFTPLSFNKLETPIAQKTPASADTDVEIRPRISFSISDMFPSPSPSTWKLPRAGSLRSKKSFARYPGGRRIASAPQSTQAQKVGTLIQDGKGLGNHTHIYASGETHEDVVNATGQNEVFQRSPSSPLPPLNRLSAFEVDLPESVPSHPTSPQLDTSIVASSRFSPMSSPFSPSLIGQTVHRNKAHRPSGAPSEPTSTLLGSDNDNSRLMSGDEDDADGRSETIYDSTRTGATGHSHAGILKPPIGTIFDESPPPEPPSKGIPNHKLTESMPVNESVAMYNEQKQLVMTNRTVSPAGGTNDLSCKEQDSPTREANEFSFSPETANATQSAPNQPNRPNLPNATYEGMDRDEDDELWSFDSAENLRGDQELSNRNLVGDEGSPLARILPRSRIETPRRRYSPPSGIHDRSGKSNIFEWSEQAAVDKDSQEGDSPRPKTVHGRQGKELRGSRFSGRRGPSALHLRSQSVPVPKDNRNHSNASKLDSWVLGNKGPSEDWDGDFEFEEPSRAMKQSPAPADTMRSSQSAGMLVPRAILERQASFHGQFGQVKELTLLVEELKRLQHQGSDQGIMNGQSAELWKEAEGIINLATLDDEEQEPFPPRSPHSPTLDFGFFDEDSPSNRTRRRSGFSPPPKEDRLSVIDDSSGSQPSSRQSQELSKVETSPTTARPSKESSAKAKSVLETIHQQRSHYDPNLLDPKVSHKKLPFDTTSLKDLVTRAGVVTRALKEEVRRAENKGEYPPAPATPDARPSAPPDPPFSQMFAKPPPSPPLRQSPRLTQSPKSPKSPKSTVMGGSISNNDNEINGHMKIMTVV